jgi:putative ABC transport system permease protein
LSRLIGEELATSGAQLRLNPDPQLRRELLRQLAGIPGIRSVTSQDEIVRHLTQTLLKNQYVFILALIGFAGVIFFGSILNASLVNLAERQREVATFRALGYTPWQVGAIFLRESLLVNLTGSLLGLPVGYGLMWLTATGFNNELIRIPVVSAPWIWLVTMLISLAFALLAHAVVQWSLYRLDFLEALQIKE